MVRFFFLGSCPVLKQDALENNVQRAFSFFYALASESACGIFAYLFVCLFVCMCMRVWSDLMADMSWNVSDRRCFDCDRARPVSGNVICHDSISFCQNTRSHTLTHAHTQTHVDTETDNTPQNSHTNTKWVSGRMKTWHSVTRVVISFLLRVLLSQHHPRFLTGDGCQKKWSHSARLVSQCGEEEKVWGEKKIKDIWETR